jgi:hypothetical protein
VLLLSLGLTIVIIISVVRSGVGLAALSLLVTLIGFYFWWAHFLIRKFVFKQSSFMIVRYILPPKTINYSDVEDIGSVKIKTKKGNLHLAGMINSDELINKFNDLISQGKIHQHNLEHKLRAEETVWRKAMLPSLGISLPLCALAFYFWPFDRMWFSAVGFGIVCGLITALVISIIQWMIRKKQTRVSVD